ncbi:hypothetical protein [Ottowia testudinis]|uniref:Uncharacterized protein n=1 Tax=Ottowia testudinis TaxID=2816950 RepID=A0A975CGJ8_9BURK|nr:hypothetical protein [Ottowia testudinis]QTD43769.1 hypothetical protein J1M35_11430 [Ottowia testudinis]
MPDKPLLLFAALIFPFISWATLLGSYWTARQRKGQGSSCVFVPFIGPLLLNVYLSGRGFHGAIHLLPWIADAGTVMVACAMPRLVRNEWRTSRFTRLFTLKATGGAMQAKITFHTHGHYALTKQWQRRAGETGIISLGEVGTYVQRADGLLLISDQGPERFLRLQGATYRAHDSDSVESHQLHGLVFARTDR